MRADRLVALILVLQNKGKLTTAALADELGVSRRTILRDVEALSMAGVPVYSEGGHGGGIALDEQYRTSLTGLHTPEVQALFVAQNQAALRDVGLEKAADQLVLKLLAALPTPQHITVDHIRQRLMIDPTWWWNDAETSPYWQEIQRAVYEDRVITACYESYSGETQERTLEPYSLVNKSSLWYLVALRDGEFRTYRVSRFHDVRVLDQRFVRRPDYDLPQYWQAHLQEFVTSFTEYGCTLRIHPDRVTFVQWLMPGRWQILDEPDGDGWLHVRLMLDSEMLAKMLIFGLGTDGEVLDPPELRQAVAKDAARLAQHLTVS